MKTIAKLAILGLGLATVNPAFATYPVIDFKNIVETVKQLQEATKQTKILDKQTTVMIEELAVSWSTFDNAVSMYESLGNATKLEGFVKNHAVTKSWDSFSKKVGNGDINSITAGTKLLDRVVTTTTNPGDELAKAEKRLTRRNYLSSLVKTSGESDAQAQAKVNKLTNQEISNAMVNDSWNAQADIAQDVEAMRKANESSRAVLKTAANTAAPTLLEAMNDVKLAVAQNTAAVIDNSDTQNQILAAQTHALNVNNELLKQQLEIQARSQAVSATMSDFAP